MKYYILEVDESRVGYYGSRIDRLFWCNDKEEMMKFKKRYMKDGFVVSDKSAEDDEDYVLEDDSENHERDILCFDSCPAMKADQVRTFEFPVRTRWVS